MPYKIDFEDGNAIEWHLTESGAQPQEVSAYQPTIFVNGAEEPLRVLIDALNSDPKVAGLQREKWFLSLGADSPENVLRIDLEEMREVRTLAREIKSIHETEYPPGTYDLYNIDLSPQFRYCLETESNPVPAREPTILELELDNKALAQRVITELKVDDRKLGEEEETVLRRLHAILCDRDPDVLVMSSAEIVPLLMDRAHELAIPDFKLGRRSGYEQLAGANTFESYGNVGHSPARYDVPGRAIIALNNSFLWSEGKIAGLIELVRWSWKPLQETGWASIGTSFTAMQMREAMERQILLPWNKWDPEDWKSVETLHAADRGGFTFAPEVGVHENIVEIDFSSLYPNIMCEFNISPETVNCDCHSHREDVPELGYSVCDRRGFLVDVLQPLIDQRDRLKVQIDGTKEDRARRRLEHRSEALKWVLVTCFGYQGYRNAKFGRIECHEAINAYARDILVSTKETLEEHGWAVIHGIVDSLWVKQMDSDATPIETVCKLVSKESGIRLEREGDFEWVCFVPLRDSTEAGALTKYFGKREAEEEFKYRGIEVRQRCSPEYIAECQEEFIRIFDKSRTAEAVIHRCKQFIEELKNHEVPPDRLQISKQASKALEEYVQRTTTLGALKRSKAHGIDRQPGEAVSYVVIDNDATAPEERVRLPFEPIEEYDAEFYTELLMRACESVVSPLGYTEARLREELKETTSLDLNAFHG